MEGCLMARPKMSTHGSLKILTISFQDESGVMPVTWYNMPFLRNQLKMGTRYILRGKITKKRDRLVLEQPKLYGREEFFRQVGKLQPVYPLTAGITNHALIKAIRIALAETENLQEYLPSEIRKRQNLITYKKALQQIHFPTDRTEMIQARKRLVFDELFLYSLALSVIRKGGKKQSVHVMEERP